MRTDTIAIDRRDVEVYALADDGATVHQQGC